MSSPGVPAERICEMSITPQEAARIARDRGLSLSDARALLGMADSETEAAELADQFVSNETEHQQTDRIVDDILGVKR